jgi:hypothetical protein
VPNNAPIKSGTLGNPNACYNYGEVGTLFVPVPKEAEPAGPADPAE